MDDVLFVTPAMLSDLSLPVRSTDLASPSNGPHSFLLQGDFVSLQHAFQTPITWSEHQHPDVEVMILFSPAICRLRWKDRDGEWRDTPVKGPALILLPPKIAHAPVWECEAEMITLYLKPALFKRLSRGAGVLNLLREPVSFFADDFFIWQTFSALRYFLRGNARPDRVYIDALGALVTGHLIWRLLNRAPAGKGGATFSREKLKEILALMHEQLLARVSIPDLARRAGLSRAHFAETFKNTTGNTPCEYLMQRRVLHAQDLLASGEHRVAEVAAATGFYDQSHLNRHFKKLLGVPPRAYLAQLQGMPEKRTD